jgi:hypothetical protein
MALESRVSRIEKAICEPETMNGADLLAKAWEAFLASARGAEVQLSVNKRKTEMDELSEAWIDFLIGEEARK